ncbi:PD-(D/E)XK motif protein [Streptomyces sp. MAR4 CNX-425]|uniref:PD-(D/E)XK motif protein n=1 Tax=Streptomyces sp. MAR4 CNX-425 TaxID=3406343 RepID=UPI003B5110F3
MSPGDPRFPGVAWSTIEERLAEGMGVRYPLSSGARPDVQYQIEGGGDGISLLVGLERTQQPPRSPLAAVRVEPVSHEGRRMARFSTTRPELWRDFHDLLMAVAERIVVHGCTLERAFDLTVHAWSALLNRPHALGAQRRIGIHGELAVLQRLAERDGWAAASAAWVGPHGEEHDFALAHCDLEVKTTASERRCHTIDGVGQLQEAPGRRLWFVSVQLTRGGRGGRTLSESIEAIREAAAASDLRATQQLDDALASLGWNPDQPDDERWTVRSEPLALHAEAMPRLTLDMLPTTQSGRIATVIYDVDVTGAQPETDCPVDLAALRLP